MEDVSLILECVAGFDKRDSTSFKYQVDKYSEKVLVENAEGLTIGIPEEYNVTELSKEHRELWKQSVEKMEASGAKIKQISLPHTKYALPTYYILSSAEASSNKFQKQTQIFKIKSCFNSIDIKRPAKQPKRTHP